MVVPTSGLHRRNYIPCMHSRNQPTNPRDKPLHHYRIILAILISLPYQIPITPYQHHVQQIQQFHINTWFQTKFKSYRTILVYIKLTYTLFFIIFPKYLFWFWKIFSLFVTTFNVYVILLLTKKYYTLFSYLFPNYNYITEIVLT